MVFWMSKIEIFDEVMWKVDVHLLQYIQFV